MVKSKSMIWLVAWALLLVVSPASLAWEITRFKIYYASPIDSSRWYDQENVLREATNYRAQPIDQKIIQEMEAFLQETAELYSSMGFADPVKSGHLDSVVEIEGGVKAIRVYLYPTTNGPGGWYSSGKPEALPRTSRKVININSLTYTDSKSLADANYQTLAHELVHAIQAASKSCQANKCPNQLWFKEGSADALGYYASKQLRQLQFKEQLKDNRFIKVYGARPYWVGLNNPADSVDESYATSSFWTYLAELAYAAEHGKIHTHATPEEEASFRYLADFYNTEYPYGKGADAEITWVNHLIQKHPHLSGDLPTLYAQFVSVFANHINTRVGPLGLVPEQTEREPRWLKRLFTECPTAGPVGDFLPGSVSLHMFSKAARCAQVDIKGSTGKTLRIQAQNSDQSLLAQLRIGLLDGSYVSAPIIAKELTGNGEHIAYWDFPIVSDGKMTLIISNMAKEPANTKRFTQKYLLLVDQFNHNLGGTSTQTQPAKQSPSTAPKSTVPQNNTAKKSTRQRVREHIQQAIADPLNHLAPITKAERRNYQDNTPCGSDSLWQKKCNSKLKLTLALSPLSQRLQMLDAQTFALPTMTEGQIGVDHMGNAIDANYLRAAMQTEQYLETIDGSKITIELPRIDYGFTGTIDNAMIRVSNGNNIHHPYESHGPTIDMGLRKIHRPPNGQVVIEEYQPTVIRGSFTAALVDVKDPGSDDDPKVAKNISGQFLIPAPWRGDESYEFNQEHFKYSLQQKMLQVVPFGTQGVEQAITEMGGPPVALCESGYSDAEIASMGFLQTCEQVMDIINNQIDEMCSCACDKEPIESQLDYCPTACEQQWQMCAANAAGSNEPTIPDDLEAQVQLYQQYLSSKNVPENLRHRMVDAFRKAPQFQRKMMLEEYANE